MLAAYAPPIETLGHYYRWSAADQELDEQDWVAEVLKLPLVQNREIAEATARGLKQTYNEYIQSLAKTQKEKAKAALRRKYVGILFTDDEETPEVQKKRAEDRASMIANYQKDARTIAADVRRAKLTAMKEAEPKEEKKDWRDQFRPLPDLQSGL